MSLSKRAFLPGRGDFLLGLLLISAVMLGEPCSGKRVFSEYLIEGSVQPPLEITEIAAGFWGLLYLLKRGKTVRAFSFPEPLPHL
jgi:hypothetical protein